MGVTLRYPYEIRNERDYFGDLPEERVPREMLELGRKILAMKAGHFHPEQFEDHYERALRALIKRKQRGEKIDKPKERPSAEVIDLMDALRQSAADGRSTPSHHQRVTRRSKRVAAKRVVDAGQEGKLIGVAAIPARALSIVSDDQSCNLSLRRIFPLSARPRNSCRRRQAPR